MSPINSSPTTIFKGFIDESYSQRHFALSCLFGKSQNWMWFNQDWESTVEAKNFDLKAQGRPLISRFHAADCSTGYGEFSTWPVDERIQFTKDLLKIFEKPSNALTVSSYAVDLSDLVNAIPECASDPTAFAYRLLLKFVMLEIGSMFGEANSGDISGMKISLVHDRCAYNGALQTAFGELSRDETFASRHVFTTLAAKGWEDCTPLQPADLIAYENFKEAERQGVRPEMEMRRSLRALLEENSKFGGRSKGFNKENLENLKRLMDASTETNLGRQKELQINSSSS